MRHWLFYLFTLLALPIEAQTLRTGPLHSADSPRPDWILPGDTIMQDGDTVIYGGKPQQIQRQEAGSNWGLHEGLNVSADLSAFATFGSHAPHKGGLSQRLSFAYLKPLTKDNRLWMLAGASINHTNYGGDHFFDGGFYGMLDYQFSPKWDAYIYGQYNVANNRRPFYDHYWGYGYYSPWSFGFDPIHGTGGFMDPGAKVLGAGFRYSPTPYFSIDVNVQHTWYDNRPFRYRDNGEYPAPR